ncbi:MAG: DoxX family membrane protein [Chloroflexi bacterium]|nr:DoxX family membrane protein [Chloroflexota bacterium]
MTTSVTTLKGAPLRDPSFITALLNDKRASVIWLVLRLWLGWQWLESGLGKFSNPAWMQSGDALKGFWSRAVLVPEQGRPPISFDWYRAFIQSMLDAQAYTWFAKLIVFGELFIGISLIIGLFVGVTAFFGGFMNWNFIMAGSASVNGMFLIVSVVLFMAWKVAGFLGVDYFLLPRIALWSDKKETAKSLPRVGEPAAAD